MPDDLKRLAAQIKRLSFDQKLELAAGLFRHGRVELAMTVARDAVAELGAARAASPAGNGAEP